MSATIFELKAACLGADPAFLCGQLEAGATIESAKTAWMAEQNNRLQATQQQLTAATAPKPGVKAITGKSAAGSAVGGDAIAQWDAALAEKVAGGMTKAAGVRALVKENPELHQAYITAYTAEHGDKVRRGN